MHLLAALFLAALLGTLALTPVAAKIGRTFGALDQPGTRKIHTSARPRTGGLAIFCTFLLLVGVASLTPLFPPWFSVNQGFFFILSGLILAFAAGLIDDFVSPARSRAHRRTVGWRVMFIWVIERENGVYFKIAFR
ncbi:MAG: hypothetical protein R6V55_14185, partial [Desulfovermiculus sp.]